MKYIQGDMMFFLFFYFHIGRNRNALSLLIRNLQTLLTRNSTGTLQILFSQQNPVLTALHTLKFE